MILQAADLKGAISGEMIEMLAMSIRKGATKLVDAKCESVMQSTEVGRGS